MIDIPLVALIGGAVSLVILCLILIYELTRTRRHLKAALGRNLDYEAKLAAKHLAMLSARRNSDLNEDRARKNQTRWIKFRNDMVRFYAVHEFVAAGPPEVVQRMAEWDELTVGDQAEWIQRGHDFVERNYGSWIG
jgi:hypothetical protein